MIIPKISVIIPVYGVEKYIRKTMESICNQTFTDYEIIIVDDASPDKSWEIAKTVLDNSTVHYKYLKKENGGLSDARQFGIENSESEWVAFLDSDDVVDPHFLEVLYDLVSSNNVDVGIVSYKTTKELDFYPTAYDTSKKSLTINRLELLESFLTRRFKPVLPAFIIKRSFIYNHNVLNAPHCRFSEDDYYMWQLFFASSKVAVSNMELYYYVQRGGSISSSSKADNILTGYDAFSNLLLNHDDWNNIYDNTKYIMPRWVLGALRTTAVISSYDVFCDVAEKMNYKKYMKALSGFPEFKAKILSRMFLISPKVFYFVVRMMS